MDHSDSLNDSAGRVFARLEANADRMGVRALQADCGAKIVDCGVHCPGGLEAGFELAKLCTADLTAVSLTHGPADLWPGPWIQVTTDQPVRACMYSQYAGWPVKSDGFFAMGSGPMRIRRGREPLLESLEAVDAGELAVGSLECDQIPGDDIVRSIARECGVSPENLRLAIAPTRSIAGCIQVVARSIETPLHKMFELGFDLSLVAAATGLAPLCPPTPDFALAIGRTNDAILYGGQVSLWVQGDDAPLADLARQLPSNASRDFGRPFAEIFQQYDFDFYKIDPHLFSPAQITVVNLSSGRSWRFGECRPDLLKASFGTVTEC